MTAHILFAAYQTDRKSNGGMESATQIFEALAGDFRWTLLTNRETAHTVQWREGGARVVGFDFDENDGGLRRRLRLGVGSARAVSVALRERPTVFHGNDIRGVQMLAPAAWLMGRPLAFTLRSTKPPGDAYGTNWHHVARRVHALITLSDDMGRLISGRLAVPQERIFKITSIVDLTAFRPADVRERRALRDSLGIRPDEVALGMVAGVFGLKRQLEVITQVMPVLADTEARLHLIGDFSPGTDAYACACARAVEEAGLADRVVFHGFRKEVPNWLRALDVVIIASQREGLARSMIEAMACATPVVSVEVSSAREMLEPTGAGTVVGANDWAALAKAVRAMIDDPARRETMGLAGRTVAEACFDEKRIAGQWREFYQRLAQTGGLRIFDDDRTA